MPIDPTRPSSDYTTYVRERADIVKRGTLDFSSSLFRSAVFASAFSPPEPPAPQYGVLDFTPKYLYYTGLDIDEFTAECFFNYTGGGVIFDFRTNNTSSVAYVKVFDRKILIYNAGAGNSEYVSVNPNTWHYLAISRSGSKIYITLNGVTTELGEDLIEFKGNTLLIGSSGSPRDSYDPFGGVISNFRLVKRALYTQAGTTDIPARPLGNIADTDLLLLANNGSLYDSSDEHRVAIGTCRTSNGILDFRQYLIYRDLNPGTSDFTVECFFKYYTGGYTWAFNGSGNERVALRVENGEAWLRGEFNGFIGHVSPNNWYHCAITRSGNDWYGTLNGFTTKIATDQYVVLDGWNLCIAGKYYYERLRAQFDGVITNFRYVKRALYNTETVYPIPTVPLTSIANTELLLVARSNARLADSSGNGRVAESICDWVQDSIVPPTVDYGILTGFSAEPARLLQYPEFGDPGQNFTVEFFFKCSDVNYLNGLYLWFIGINFGMCISDGTLFMNQVAITSVTPNRWYHVALTRRIAEWYVSVDGFTNSVDIGIVNFGNGTLCIGDDEPGDTPFYTGSISNFRISNYARYTDAYTVPSVPMQPSNTDLLLLLAKPEAPFADSAIPPREAKVSTTQCEWAPGPIQFSNPGYAGYYMKIDTPDYIGFNPKNIVGTSFTLEWFMRTNDPITERQELLEIGSGGYLNNAYVYVYINDTGMQIESSLFPDLSEALAPTTRTWSHYAITFTSTETKVFFNGKKVLTGGTCGTWINVSEFYFGFDFALYSTSIRLSNTVLYTTDFTPTLPLTANTSVKFLVDKEVPDDWDYKGDVTTLIGPIEIGSS